MDRVLHPGRVAGRGKHGHKPTFTATFASIPDGVMFHRQEGNPVALLTWKGAALVWSPEGYTDDGAISPEQTVVVLTPKTVVEVIRVGYVPMVLGSTEL